MDRGSWRATVHVVTKEFGMTAVTWHTCSDEKSYKHIQYHTNSHLQSKDSNSGPMTLNLMKSTHLQNVTFIFNN